MRSAYWPDAVDDHGVFVGNAWQFVDRCMGSHDRCLDRYERRDGEWRISHRICVHEGTTTLAASPMAIEAGRFRSGDVDRATPGRPIGT